jgi:putative membrane protein
MALAGLVGVGAARAQDKARDFLKEALAGDNSEMMLGKMAAEQGSATRDYGRMLAMDHGMHRDKVLKAGASLHLEDDHNPAREAAQERDKLAGLHGRDFDKEFAAYMVKDHRKDIADYEKAQRLPGAPGRLAKATLPTLHKHLKAAQRLAG